MSGALAFTLLACVVSSPADDRIFSGPQPGERIVPFAVFQVAGANAGTEFQLLADHPDASVVLIFVHEATRPGLQLMRPVDLFGAKLAKDGLKTHFIWLSADRSKTEDWLRTARPSLNLKSPINISLDGIEGPGSYGLNRKVTLTVLTAKDGTVTGNFAIVQPNETDAPAILKAMAQLVEADPPSVEELRTELGAVRRPGKQRMVDRPPGPDRSKLPDDPAALIEQVERKLAELEKTGTESATLQHILRLEAQIARLQARDQENYDQAVARVAELENVVAELVLALNDARASIAKIKGEPAPNPIKITRTDRKETDKQPAQLPGRTPSDPELISLMRRMIQPANDEETVKQIANEMRQWAGDDPQRKEDLRQFAIRIAHVGYGTDAAKAMIRNLAE